MAVEDPAWGDWERLALQTSRIGLWWWDRRTGEVRWDATLEEIYGLEPGTFGGNFADWVERVHPEDRDEVLEQLDATLQSGGPHYLLFRTLRPDGTVRWVESRGTVVTDERGASLGMTGACQDITERQEEEARRYVSEQRLRERFEFLAEAGKVLSRASIDTDDTLQEFTNLVVPRLSDWCAVDLLEDGQLRLAAVAHSDDTKVELVREMVGRYGRSRAEGAGKVVATGEPEHAPHISDEMLQATAHDERHLELLRQLGLTSAVIVPLQARGRTLGALTLIHSESGRRHDDADVAVARELAHRAAVAIDNANLLAERTRVARMLQQALLPPQLPEIPGVQLAGLYDPAEDTDIGGDFYDAMGAGTDWTLVVGDVCGKGVEAAALTSLARHTVRTASLHDSDPRHVLGVLNEALRQHEGEHTFCTAVCAHLRLIGGGAMLSVASGGHPPALVLRQDGGVDELDADGLLLGCFDDADLGETEARLDAGDLALFYTDGLTEARRGNELFGAERLKDALRDAAGLTAEETLKHLHATVEAWQFDQRDDTAMVACRVES